MTYPCPCCQEPISPTPIADGPDQGQVSCPECGSLFPDEWARQLHAFETEREKRSRDRKD